MGNGVGNGGEARARSERESKALGVERPIFLKNGECGCIKKMVAGPSSDVGANEFSWRVVVYMYAAGCAVSAAFGLVHYLEVRRREASTINTTAAAAHMPCQPAPPPPWSVPYRNRRGFQAFEPLRGTWLIFAPFFPSLLYALRCDWQQRRARSGGGTKEKDE